MHAVVAGIVAAIATYLLTPLAMRVASATNFMDRPAGYKGHQRATPYLGGSAIFVGLLAGLAVGGLHHRYTVVIVASAIVWIMGTIDDRVSLPILLRVTVEVGLAIWLSASGLGWTIFHQGIADGVLTVLWMLGLMNAFNLMDNMDGAAASTAAASAIGAAGIALMSNQRAPATVCLATAGACIGFLRWNLAKPAKVFMGDGGSLPLGLIVAAMTMSTVNRDYFGPRGVVAAALLVALVIFDTTLVTISRSRAGRSVMSGGRDHTTHRLKALLGTPQRVALTLAVVQLLFCAAALGVVKAGGGWIFLAGGLSVLAGGVLLWQLETQPIFEPEKVPQVRRGIAAPTTDGEALGASAEVREEAVAKQTANAEPVLARSAHPGN